jgi:ABC-type protease/lipase transport system fused ATPase/permease subunit
MGKKKFDFNLLIGPLGIVFLVLFYLLFGEVTTFFFALVAGIVIWLINWQTDWELNRYKREFDKESIKKFNKNQVEEQRLDKEQLEEMRLREIWEKFREEEKNNERKRKRKKKK